MTSIIGFVSNLFLSKGRKGLTSRNVKNQALTLLYNNAAGNVITQAITLYAANSPMLQLIQLIRLVVPKKILGAILVGGARVFVNISSRISSFSVFNFFKTKTQTPSLETYIGRIEKLQKIKQNKLNLLENIQSANPPGRQANSGQIGETLCSEKPAIPRLIGQIKNLEKDIQQTVVQLNTNMDQIPPKMENPNNKNSIMAEFIEPIQTAINGEILRDENVRETFSSTQVDEILNSGAVVLNNLKNQTNSSWFSFSSIFGLTGLAGGIYYFNKFFSFGMELWSHLATNNFSSFMLNSDLLGELLTGAIYVTIFLIIVIIVQ